MKKLTLKQMKNVNGGKLGSIDISCDKLMSELYYSNRTQYYAILDMAYNDGIHFTC